MSEINAKPFFLGTIISVLLLSGCTVYKVDVSPEPIIDTDESYSMTSPDSVRAEEAWWAAFSDPELDSLIRSGLANNFDVLQAVARLDQASALSLQANAERLLILSRLICQKRALKQINPKSVFSIAAISYEQTASNCDAAEIECHFVPYCSS